MQDIELKFNQELYDKQVQKLKNMLNETVLNIQKEKIEELKINYKDLSDEKIQEIISDKEWKQYIAKSLDIARQKKVNPNKNEFNNTVNSIMIPQKFNEIVLKKLKDNLKKDNNGTDKRD
jgi:hypothetical protein